MMESLPPIPAEVQFIDQNSKQPAPKFNFFPDGDTIEINKWLEYLDQGGTEISQVPIFLPSIKFTDEHIQRALNSAFNAILSPENLKIVFNELNNQLLKSNIACHIITINIGRDRTQNIAILVNKNANKLGFARFMFLLIPTKKQSCELPTV